MPTLGQSLGESFDPFGAHLQDPHPYYQQLREHGGPVYAPQFGAWLLARYEHADWALTSVVPDGPVSSVNALRPLVGLAPEAQAAFAEGYPDQTREPINADGVDHRRLRRPLNTALSPEAVAALRGFITKRAHGLLDAVAGKRRMDLVASYARPLPLQVTQQLFGFADDDMATVTQGSYQTVEAIASAATGPEQADAVRGLLRLQALCGRHAHQRRNTGDTADLIGRTVHGLAPGHDPLTPAQEAESARVVTGAAVAAHITTTATLAAGVHALLRHREQWEALCDNPDGLIHDATEEILRAVGSVQTFPRRLTKTATLSGVELPPNSDALLLYGAANRDPDQWEHPDRFDITRTRKRHLAFGAGPHYCVGAPLARAEIQIALHTLTQRLPGLRLQDPDTPPRMQATLITRGPAELPVVW